jgi:hypothetical protein
VNGLLKGLTGNDIGLVTTDADVLFLDNWQFRFKIIQEHCKAG